MSKHGSNRGKATDDRGPMRICVERIIPDEVDRERLVRRAMREEMIRHAGGNLGPGDERRVAKMAVQNSKKWPQEAIVKCKFLDGSAKMKRKVRSIAQEWEKYVSINFKFVAQGDAEIRISFFADAGSWSAVGRDALNREYFPLHQPTMNYGWLRDDSDDEEYRSVVLHEFGHALSCIHEHQQPNFDRVWDEAAVMKYFQGPPNYWTPDDIRFNVLEKYSPKGISATDFDPKSIMLYSFDGRLFSDGKGPTNENSKLSPTDMKMIKRMYP